MKNRIFKALLVVSCLLMLLAVLVACGENGGGGNGGGTQTDGKILPKFSSLVIDPVMNGFNGDEENDVCLEIVSGEVEAFNVIVNISNPDRFEVLSLNVNDVTYEASRFGAESDANKIVIESLTTTLTEGEFEIKVDKIMYSLKGTPTRMGGIKGTENVKTLRISPSFNLTFNYGELSYGGTSTESSVELNYRDTIPFVSSTLMNAYFPEKEGDVVHGKEGYIFTGWYTEEGGNGTQLDESAEYYFYKDVTLYAHYDRAFTYSQVGEGISVTGITEAGKRTSFSIEIPSHIDGVPVREVADNAFATAASGKVIVLPDTLLKIGARAFQGATNLQIDLGSVEVIGDQAFENCGKLILGKDSKFSQLRNGSLPSSLKEIGKKAFKGCTWDTNLKNPLREGYLKGTDTLFIPQTVLKIGEEAFFESKFITVYFESGRELEYAENVEDCSIGASVFEGSKSLTNLYTGVSFIQTGAGQLNTNGKSALKDIPPRAFYGCTSLKTSISDISVKLNEGLETVGELAFASGSAGLKDLTYLAFPDSLKVIGKQAFANTGLTEVVFNESSTLETLGEWCFENAKFTEITLYSLTKMGKGPFWGSTSLKKINILTNNVPVFQEVDFWGDGLTRGFKYYVKSSLLSAFRSASSWVENGADDYVCAYDYIATAVGGTTLCFEPIDGEGNLDFNSLNVRVSAVLTDTREIVIPTSFSHQGRAYTVTAVGKYFVHQNVTKVTLPSTLVRIDEMAFYACDVLYDVVWKDGNTVLNKGENKDIALEYIGQSAFSGTAITKFYSNTALKVIGKQAFHNCKNLSHVVIDRGTELKIEGSAFSQSGLKTLVIGANVKNIYDSAFQNDTELSLVLINRPETAGSIDELVPESTDGNYPASGSNPFYKCTGLSNIYLFSNNAYLAFTSPTVNGKANGYAEVKKKDGITSAYSVYGGTWQEALVKFNIY